jgi:hypothetical protein
MLTGVRRVLLLLLALPVLLASPSAAEEELGDPLPDPDSYPAAGPGCQDKRRMSPFVATPGVDWPSTYRCVLDIHTCDGVRTYTSGVRPGGTGMCADFWSVHDALARREICCDAGANREERSVDIPMPTPEPPPPQVPPPPAAPVSEPKYTDCTEEMQKQIEEAVYDASLALEFSGCMERNGQSFAKWNERLERMKFVCWDAITNQDDPPCAKAGKKRETAKKFSRDTITIFSRNIASCGCLHANIIHELAHTFGYGHGPPRNAYELELDCAACGK